MKDESFAGGTNADSGVAMGTTDSRRCTACKRNRLFFTLITLAMVFLFGLNLFVGAVNIPFGDVVGILTGGSSDHPSWHYIVLDSRLPQAVTALLCGASLSVSGLMLQTAFRNPLAGPGIFGISSGASLGVAVVMLSLGGSIGLGGASLTGFLAVMAAAFAGAMIVLGIILAFAGIVKSNVMLLIVGIMTGYITSAAISLLNFFATETGVQSYIIWGLGNFGGVTSERLPLFSAVNIAALAASLTLIKPLNALLLGEHYAENLGFNIRATRNRLLIITGVLTAVTTVFCGPVAFIGLAVPHIARLLLGTDNHNRLMPAAILTGATISLLCNVICSLPADGGMIPLNAVTPLIGAPVIIYVIIKGRG